MKVILVQEQESFDDMVMSRQPIREQIELVMNAFGLRETNIEVLPIVQPDCAIIVREYGDLTKVTVINI